MNKLIDYILYWLNIKSDIGKCTKCRFNNGKYQNCTVGTYWAEKGLNKICYNGELWETIK